MLPSSVSRYPPTLALDNHRYLDPPANFWRYGYPNTKSKAYYTYTVLIGIDAMQTGNTVEIDIHPKNWPKFIALVLLSGLPRPIAVMRSSNAVCVLCPALFGTGFSRVNTNSKAEQYRNIARQAGE